MTTPQNVVAPAVGAVPSRRRELTEVDLVVAQRMRLHGPVADRDRSRRRPIPVAEMPNQILVGRVRRQVRHQGDAFPGRQAAGGRMACRRGRGCSRTAMPVRPKPCWRASRRRFLRPSRRAPSPAAVRRPPPRSATAGRSPVASWRFLPGRRLPAVGGDRKRGAAGKPGRGAPLRVHLANGLRCKQCSLRRKRLSCADRGGTGAVRPSVKS